MNPTPAKPGSSPSPAPSGGQANVYPRAASRPPSTPRPAGAPAGVAKSGAAPAGAATAAAAKTAHAGSGGATASSAKHGAPGPAAPPPGPAAKSAASSVDKAGAPAASPEQLAAAARRKQMILIGSGAAVLLLIGVFVYMKFMRPVDAPRLNSPPHVIGSFTATGQFDRLPFEKKWQYYELMDNKEDALKAAYAAGQMNDDEYRKALQAAYYGKHLDRMKKYFEKSPGRERTAYLDKLVQKKYADDEEKGDGKVTGKSDKTSALTAEEIKRDDTEQEDDVSAWPADVRSKWEEYKREYKARKDLFKQARDAEKARKNAPATKPVAVPG